MKHSNCVFQNDYKNCCRWRRSQLSPTNAREKTSIKNAGSIPGAQFLNLTEETFELNLLTTREILFFIIFLLGNFSSTWMGDLNAVGGEVISFAIRTI